MRVAPRAPFFCRHRHIPCLRIKRVSLQMAHVVSLHTGETTRERLSERFSCADPASDCFIWLANYESWRRFPQRRAPSSRSPYSSAASNTQPASVRLGSHADTLARSSGEPAAWEIDVGASFLEWPISCTDVRQSYELRITCFGTFMRHKPCSRGRIGPEKGAV